MIIGSRKECKSKRFSQRALFPLERVVYLGLIHAQSMWYTHEWQLVQSINQSVFTRQSIDSIGSMWYPIHYASGKCHSMMRIFYLLHFVSNKLLSINRHRNALSQDAIIFPSQNQQNQLEKTVLNSARSLGFSLFLT